MYIDGMNQWERKLTKFDGLFFCCQISLESTEDKE